MPGEAKRSNLSTVVLAVVLAIFAAVATTILVREIGPTPVQAKPTKTSGLQTILDRGVIRAGYVSNPPSCTIDPNTGKVSGIFVDAIETIAEKAKLKVDWTEEVGFGSMIEGLNANRYDMVPCAIWPTTERARHAAFTQPLFYSGVGVYVRADDTRFDGNLEAINSSSVKIATIDGEMAAAIAKTDFPKAQQVSLPQLSEIATMLLNVKEGKADVTFVEKFFAHEFLKNNPGSLKNITADRPVRIFSNTILVRRGQNDLLDFLNTSMKEITNLGIVNQLLRKYEPTPGTFYALAPPYGT